MYSALHEPAGWALPQVLAEQAARQAAAPWITVVDGESLSFATADSDSRRVAGFIASLGIEAGERVAVLRKRGAGMAWDRKKYPESRRRDRSGGGGFCSRLAGWSRLTL